MRKKSVFAVLLIAVMCFVFAGCSFNVGNMKKSKKKVEPPTDKQVIKAVEAEYDGEGDWEITDDEEDDGDYVWELECEDGATAIVKWSDTDDEDDLYVKIDDSGVIVETTPEPTDEPAPVTYSYTGYFTDTEDGANTYASGTKKLELWITGAEVSAVEIYHNNALFYEFSDSDIEGANEYLIQKGGYATFYVESTTPFEEGDYTYYVYSPDGFIEYTDVCTVSGGSSTGAGSSGEEALDGLEQYEIIDSSAGISNICWEGAQVVEGIATYKLGSELGLSFNSSKSSVVIDVYCYSLVNDSDQPQSDDDLTDEKYLVSSATLTPDADGSYEYSWTDDAGEDSMYIVIVSSGEGSKTTSCYFFTACFVSESGF